MAILAHILFLVYLFTLTVITLYCLMLGHLLIKYKSRKSQLEKVQFRDAARIVGNLDNWPFVTIQLPVYNEIYVVERLIDCVMQLDYPAHRFEVQVLDDSTDETLDLVRNKVKEYQSAGFHIIQIRRPERTGFKAGALNYAFPSAKGEFIAIFDADFLPKPDFLKTTIGHFTNIEVGVVQTRWEHLNEDFSILTKLQALQLNAHFRVEQQGRFAAGYLLQFNGTAGIWRKNAIETSGGWQADTLTEDLDLSIRAQLKGWKIIYIEDLGSPAELPSEMNGLKSQQFRWMKGGAETARKMLPHIWSSQLLLIQKIQATMQLLAGSIFIFIFFMGVLSVPAQLLLEFAPIQSIPIAWSTIGLVFIIAVQYISNVEAESRNQSYSARLFQFVLHFPIFLALSMGLSLHNSMAVIQGWLGLKSSFVRTPKFNIKSFGDSFRAHKYLSSRVSGTTIAEGFLAIYFLTAIIMGFKLDNPGFLMLHFLFFIGFSIVFVYSLKHLRLNG